AVGQFLLFGLGMGAVLAALTLATAWFGDSLVRLIRPLGRHVGWVSAVLLWVAGAYIVYYWLPAIRLSVGAPRRFRALVRANRDGEIIAGKPPGGEPR